jgi:hypothetical protein
MQNHSRGNLPFSVSNELYVFSKSLRLTWHRSCSPVHRVGFAAPVCGSQLFLAGSGGKSFSDIASWISCVSIVFVNCKELLPRGVWDGA